MLKFKFLFFALMLTCLSGLRAQALLGREGANNVPEGDQLPNSTHANSGDELYNVDLYTGIGSTNIPIYEYQVDGLDLGVSLSYFNKGIRMDDIASSVGLGWEIVAGGGIDRMAQGLEDELTVNNWDGNPILGPWVDNAISGHRDYSLDIFTANLGGRTVKFAMNTYNGFVYTMPKSELKVYARHKVKNLYLMGAIGVWTGFATHPTDTITFTVVDEKGNSFYFIQGDRNFRITDAPKTYLDTSYVTNKFVLAKVQTYTGKTIKFNYRQSTVKYKQYTEEKVWETQFGIILPETKDIEFDGYISHLTDIEYPNGVKVYFNTDDQNHARCDLPGGVVLSSIKIEGAYDNSIKHSITYKLNHSYFYSPNSNDTRTEVAHRTPCNDLAVSSQDPAQPTLGTRLKLNSIDRMDANGNGERFFTFEYHASPLPKRLSPKRDYYGFSNNGTVTPLVSGGLTYNLSVPIHTSTFTTWPVINSTMTYGTDRNPDNTTNLDYIQACILKKVKTGQGGEIEFKYQKPVLYNIDPVYSEQYYGNRTYMTKLTGQDPGKEGRDATDGLVIHQVIKKDALSQQHTVVTQYNYIDGQRFYPGGYFWKPVLMDFDTPRLHLTVLEKQYFNFFLAPQQFIRGSNHGFSDVTVTVHNQYTSERLSKRTYKFSNLLLPADQSTLFDPAPVTPLQRSNILHYTGLVYHTAYDVRFNKQYMGLPMEEKEYDANDQLISSKQNKYHINNKHADGLAHGFEVNDKDFWFYEPCPNCPDTTVTSQNKGREGGGEGIPTGTCRITNSTIMSYSGGTSTSIKYNFTYDFRDNIKSITWTDSKNETYRKEYVYTYDKNLVTHCAPDTAQHWIIERLVKVNADSPKYNKIIRSKLRIPFPLNETNLSWPYYPNRPFDTADFRRYPNVCQVKFPREYETSLDAPTAYDSTYLLSEQRAIDNNWGGSLWPLEKTKEFKVYDIRNNALETKLRNRDIYNSCIWDTRIDRKIAEVANAHYYEIAFTSFEGHTTPASDDDKGNWLFDPARVLAPTGSWNSNRALTGRYVYKTQSTTDTIKSKFRMVPGKKYRLSIWATGMPNVILGNTSIGLGTEMQLHDGWTLYSTVITGDSSYLKITEKYGQTTFDEIRLHPMDAQMKTSSYIPLLGIVTTCDEFNNITYYEYDMQGRPTIVRDINGHIRSQQKHVNQGTDN